MKLTLSLSAFLLAIPTTKAGCLFGNGASNMAANPHTQEGRRLMAHSRRLQEFQSLGTRDYGIPEGGFAAVREDIRKVLVASQDFFPGDFEAPHGPHYGGLMIRLAWHCNGSYRESDGRGGCDGGRIRFDPELNWPDNANLDKALKLLEPIKEKYGSDLSWGDLIVLAGTTAIESMGGPFLGFCGGRVDDIDGSDSLILGPSPEQEELTPCVSIGKQGQCDSPLGPTTMGLIYVNPEGPVTAPGDPVASGIDVRNAFTRMGFNDAETVALIGGGHAFGKSHGACPNPPCGEEPFVGIGPNTFTSGIEGAWTTIPTTWSNQYFTNLFDFEWQRITGPGGAIQWEPLDSNLPIMMLTTDLALSADPDFLPITQEFARNITALEDEFARVWYRLMTSDMGPTTRCINENPDDIPPPQAWQHPISNASGTDAPVDYVRARSMIQDLIDDDSDNIAAFSNLALRCASTFRATDYRGGCNGARIRFPPESEWPENKGTAEALATLEPIKQAMPEISYADLIVLAGQTALEDAGDVKLSFCGGRQDALDASGSDTLAPRYFNTSVLTIRDDMAVKGLTPPEGVALFAVPTSNEGLTAISRTEASNELLNQYFVDLLARANETEAYFYNELELALIDPEFLPIVEAYAADEDVFVATFSKAWTKMMNADRFDGPVGNICDSRVDATLEGNDEMTSGFGNTGVYVEEDVEMDEDGDGSDEDGDMDEDQMGNPDGMRDLSASAGAIFFSGMIASVLVSLIAAVEF